MSAPNIAELRKQNELLKAELARLEALAKETNVAEHKIAQFVVESNIAEDTSIRSPQEIREVFDQIDTDHSNFIDRDELRNIAHRLGEVLDDDEMETAFQEIDVSQDGKISFEEFSNWWLNPNRVRTSKTAVKVGVLRARIVASNLLSGAPRLIRALSEEKHQVVPPDSKDWNHYVLHASVGEMKEPKAYAHFHVEFKSPSTAGFEQFQDCGVVMRCYLKPKSGQSASERADAANTLMASVKLNNCVVHVDTSNPESTEVSVGFHAPDPLALTTQLNLDMKNFIRKWEYSVELGHGLDEFLDPNVPVNGTLASMIVARIRVDVQFRKALVLALHQLGVPDMSQLLMFGWLEGVRLQLKLGDIEDFVSTMASAGEGTDPVADVMRAQQAQLAQFQAMGLDPAIIEQVRQEQQNQLAQMQSLRQSPIGNSDFWLDENFKPKFKSLWDNFLVESLRASKQVGDLIHALGQFDELTRVTMQSPSGLFGELKLQKLYMLKYLPALTLNESTGQWQVQQQLEGEGY